MKTFTRLAFVAWAMCAAAWADTPVDRICDAAPDAQVRIKNIAGKITVQPWDKLQVQVTGTLGENVKGFEFSGGGARVNMEVVVPKHHGRKIDSCLTVSVPRASSLKIEAVSADIAIDGVEGKIEAESVSGSIEVAGARGDLDLDSVSGDVTLSANSPAAVVESTSGDIELHGDIGKLDLQTVSGDIEVTGNMGNVEAESVSGDIRIDGAAGEVEAHTISGNITIGKIAQEAEAGSTSGSIALRGEQPREISMLSLSGNLEYKGALADAGTLNAESKSGSVSICLPETTNAQFNVTTMSGNINNEFGPAPQRVSQFGPGWNCIFQNGSGTGEVEVETLSGGVRIKKF